MSQVLPARTRSMREWIYIPLKLDNIHVCDSSWSDVVTGVCATGLVGDSSLEEDGMFNRLASVQAVRVIPSS
jgi:hypothetical protein